jgi:uncharacterized protein
MPEYLAPGVYVEETSFRSKSIEGVSTTTTGFIGPSRYGPTEQTPDIITSLGEFERTYGDGEQLVFATGGRKMDNFLWHAVRAFFEEGGRRLYVSRVFMQAGQNGTGCASAPIGGDNGITFISRFPGAFGNFQVTLTLKAGQNLLGAQQDTTQGSPAVVVPTLGALTEGDVIWFYQKGGASPASPPVESGFYSARWDPAQSEWSFVPVSGSSNAFTLDDIYANAAPLQGDVIRVVTLAISLASEDGEKELGTWSGLPLDPEHKMGSTPDSLFDIFAATPGSGADARKLPLVISRGAVLTDGLAVLATLTNSTDYNTGSLEVDTSDLDGVDRSLVRGIAATFLLRNGNDGERPEAAEYEGKDDPDTSIKTGLKQFEDIEDISIVAAPGATWDYGNFRDNANAITSLLISHAERMHYRIAVLDSAVGQSISDVRKMRAKLDSKYAALYYPWVRILDPITRTERMMPPSGFVAGIYARNDINRAVYKAPANEVVNLALGFEYTLNKSQQEILNPEGINCFRFFEGRGMLLWGARTISSDPEWKYVNLRRYFIYLERSIDRGTQWAVFEPNGEALWANVRRTISDFLFNEWQMGALLGEKPEKAYFVRCDRSTMTQNDLDNGRLVCLIGVAALRPAEFVIFRIGQWTADRKV